MSTAAAFVDVLAPCVSFITDLVALVLSYHALTDIVFEASLSLEERVMTLSAGPEEHTLWIEAAASVSGLRSHIQLLQTRDKKFELVAMVPVFPVCLPFAFIQTPQKDRMYISTRHEENRLMVMELDKMTWGSQSMSLTEPAPRFLCYEYDRLYYSGQNEIVCVLPDLTGTMQFLSMPRPMGMVWYKDELHVVSYSTKSVLVWNRQGAYLRQWGYPHLHQPQQLQRAVTGTQSTWWVMDRRCIQVFSAQTEQLIVSLPLRSLLRFMVIEHQQLYVLTDKAVHSFALE